jgi:pyrimidine-nucleoside phosphorylase
MSKKLAEGIDALVLDVKTGNGAFMQTYDNSVALAQALVGIGTSMGKKTVGFVTDMSQPLGYMIGNWFEVVESIECLRGKKVDDLMEVTYVLGGAMLWLGGKAASIKEGMKQCKSAIYSGKAYEKFCQIVVRQGGDISFVEDVAKYPHTRYVIDVAAPGDGFVAGFNTMGVGILGIELGAGRTKVDDVIDPAAGIVITKKIGDRVTRGEKLATIYTNREDAAARAGATLGSLIQIAAAPVKPPHLIQAYLDSTGVKPWSTPALY